MIPGAQALARRDPHAPRALGPAVGTPLHRDCPPSPHPSADLEEGEPAQNQLRPGPRPPTPAPARPQDDPEGPRLRSHGAALNWLVALPVVIAAPAPSHPPPPPSHFPEPSRAHSGGAGGDCVRVKVTRPPPAAVWSSAHWKWTAANCQMGREGHASCPPPPSATTLAERHTGNRAGMNNAGEPWEGWAGVHGAAGAHTGSPSRPQPHGRRASKAGP